MKNLGFAPMSKHFVRLFNSAMDSPLTTVATRSRFSARRHAAPRPDRKAAILLAAEKLFAKRGYHAVTIRQIANEASVPLALVGYYYGQKHELFLAIFEHWNSTIEQRLQELRQAQQTQDSAAQVSRIIEAFVDPVLRMRSSTEGEYYALLVARELFHETDVTDHVLRVYFDPLAHAFIAALHEAMPQATRGEVAWCYQFSLGALLHHLSDYRVQRLSLNESKTGDPCARELLVNFIVGGIRAALPITPLSPIPTIDNQGDSHET